MSEKATDILGLALCTALAAYTTNFCVEAGDLIAASVGGLVTAACVVALVAVWRRA